MSSTEIEEESRKNDHIAILCTWLSRVRQSCQNRAEKENHLHLYKELELEFSIRPNPVFSHLPGRASDIGYPLFQAWRQMLGEAVIYQQKQKEQESKKREKKEEFFLSYEKQLCNDYFYMDGSIRQRLFAESNLLPQWTRKQPMNLDLMDLFNANTWSFEEQKLEIKLNLKHEKPITALPKEFRPVFVRRKTTHRYRFPEHDQCWIDLSEVQNIKFEGERSVDDGPPVYEMEVEVNASLLKKSLETSTSHVEYKKEKYDMTTWELCGNVVVQLYEILGLK